MGKKATMAKFCPRCGSTKLKMAVTPWKVSTAFFNNYYCIECGFEGYILEGNEKIIKEFQENVKRHEKKEKQAREKSRRKKTKPC